MLNFYGGPAGKSFSIAQIFSTKTGTGNSMENDISMGWKSPVSVGSYVVISYGEPGTPEYEECVKQDLEAEGQNHNATIWQKVYDEDKSEFNGIGYQLIMSMAGFTPRLEFVKPVVVLDANEEPDIDFDNSDIEKPKITLKLPRSQVLQVGELEIEDAGTPPSLDYDDKTNINKPKITFHLPQGQILKLGEVTWGKANEKPSVSLNDSDINNPTLNFVLPVAQQIKQGKTEKINANLDPRFEIDSTNPDEPVINFYLPQAQIMQDPGLEVLDSTQAPAISMDSEDVNHPKITFSLPKSASFYFGNLLGNKLDEEYTLTDESFTGYRVGDFYINDTTGFLYQVKEKTNDTTCVFKYIAHIAQPLPGVVPNVINPYTAEGQPAEPSVMKRYTNEEETAWELQFNLPKAAMPSIETKFIGSSEPGSADVKVADEETIKFLFNIPAGTRIFSGDAVSDEALSSLVEGAKLGDIYLNTTTGNLYELKRESSWERVTGNLRGPVGKSLNVIRNFTINGEDSLQAGISYIEEQYTEEVTPDMIFAVTFVQDDIENSYWYSKSADGLWGRVQLTAGMSDFVKNEYQAESITNKTYSIDYINGLIGQADGDNNLTTYSKAQIDKMFDWGNWEDAKGGV